MRKRNRHGDPHAPADARWGKKLSALFLSAAMCMTMLPGVALADEPENTSTEAQAQQDVPETETPSEPVLTEENAEIVPETPENEAENEPETPEEPAETLPAALPADTPMLTASAEHPHTEGTQHPVCGAASCTDPNHGSHESITDWKVWGTADAMPTDTGNYYLTTDVTLTDSWAPAAGTVLCLNGYSITRVNSENNFVIRLPYREQVTNSFTLTDCAETQGVITHADGSPGGGILIDSSYTNESIFNMYGGTISGNNSGNAAGAGVYASGKFNLYGGKICNNTTTRSEGGGGVYSEATFNMYGGTIENNTAEGKRGGGVSLDRGAFNMYSGVIQNNTAETGGGVYSDNIPFYMSGDAKIINNTAASKGGGICGRQYSYYISGSVKIQGNEAAGKTENISLSGNSNVAEPLHIVGALTGDAYVGVSGVVGSAAADGKQSSSDAANYTITESDLSHLHSDNEEYVLKWDADNNQVTLAEDTRPVATIGSTSYTSLQAAIDAAAGMSDKPTIVLGRDTTPASLSVTSGTFTIDLAGHSIALTTQERAVTLQDTNVTIKDSVGGGSMSSYGILFSVGANAKLTIENGSYTSQTLEPVFANASGETATVLVKDGTFNGERAGITCFAGKVTIEKGTFTGTDYGAYLGCGGSIKIADGTFTGGEWSLYDNYDYGRFELSGGEYPNGISCQEYNIGSMTPSMNSYEFVTENDNILYPNDLAVKVYKGYLKVQERAISKMSVTSGGSLYYGYTSPAVVTVKVTKAARVKDEPVTYEWSLTKKVDPSETGGTEKIDCHGTEYTVPMDLPMGEYVYTVTATCAGESRSDQTTVYVHPRYVQIDGLYVKNKVYDGTTKAEIAYVGGKPTLAGFVNSENSGVLEKDKDKVTVADGTATFANAKVGENIKVTFSGFTLTGEAAGNYRLYEQPESTTADITPKEVTATVNAVDRVYDADSTKVNLTAGNVVDAIAGDTVSVDVSDASGTMDNADAGTAKSVTVTGVKLIGKDAVNYVLSAQPEGVTVNITKAEGSVTAPTAVPNLVYNGEMQTLISEGTSETGEVQYKLGKNGTYSAELPKADKVGTYTVYYMVKGDNNHNDVAEKSISVTIGRKLIDIPVPDDTEYTYNGAEQTYKLDADTAYTITGNKQTNANESGYTVTVSLTDKENTVWADTADAADKTYSFIINKAAATVAAKDQTAYVNGTAPVLGEGAYTVSGLIGEDKLTTAPMLKYVDADGKEIAPDMTKTGETIIQASGAENSNYVFTYVDGKLTVTTRPSSGGGSSSSASTKTETTTNPDGSTTKTETKSDGTVTSTTTNKDGSITKTETKKDGSSTTEVKDASGSTGTVSTDKSGKTSASATISEKAVDEAKKSDEAVKVPAEVKAGESSASAPTVKIDLPKNAGETKVEIPVKDVTSGTVAIIIKPDGTEKIVKNSIPTENGLELTVSGSVTVKIVDNAKNFNDTKGHWAQDSIDFVSARGLVNGTSGSTFSPEAPTTRAQLWTMLARQADADLTGGATWYEKAQTWAKNTGISDGTNPNGNISRAEMVTMLWRAAGSPVVNYAMNMSDVPADAYYTEAVRWALSTGITTGVGNGKFDPNSTCTRAQIATFLSRSYLGK